MAAAEAAATAASGRAAADVWRLRRALLLPPLMRSAGAIEASRRRYEAGLESLAAAPPLRADPLDALGTAHFFLAYHGADDRPLLELQARTLDHAFGPAATPAEDAGRAAAAPLRVGFLSTHFRDHTILRLHAGLIAAMPASRIRPVLMLVNGETDAASESLAAAVAAQGGETLRLPRALAPAAAAVAAARLDVLYYADIGMDPFTYLLARHRLAPVQAVGWGHPGTTGLPTIDAFLVAEAMAGTGAEAGFSEPLLRLPHAPLLWEAEAPAALDARAVLGIPPGAPLFACLQAPFKLHPDFDRVLAAILSGDRAARLVLLAPRYDAWRRLIEERLAKAGIAVADQVVFAAPRPRREYLALVDAADVVLDPFPFGGGHTALEALALGKPLITWPTAAPRGRVAAGFLAALGIADTLADSAETYVARALRWARDASERRALAQRTKAALPLLAANAAAAEAFAAALERLAAAPPRP
ncbi:MAG: hypothetical protein JNK11_01375 [Alphaproteobacteria bacterium]|nr:hypothetical protein [Alphaproteobacteria bacterium]